MNKPFSLGSLLGIAVVTVAFIGCSKQPAKAVEPQKAVDLSAQVYPRAGYDNGLTVREITTTNGRQCVVASQGSDRGSVSITCDWSK